MTRSSVSAIPPQSRTILAGLALVALALVMGIMTLVRAAAPADPAEQLQQAQKLVVDGNFADASNIYRSLIAEPKASGAQVAQALQLLFSCQQNLGLSSTLDSDLSSALAAHPDDYLVYQTAANQIMQSMHYGVIADQQFTRGFDRGARRNGQHIDVTEQDRLQSLKWRRRAIELASAPTEGNRQAVDNALLARLHIEQAGALGLGRTRMLEWRLQALTELEQTPNYLDFESGVATPARPAPVDAEGKPVLYTVPESWQTATSDGQRLHWSLDQAAQLDATSGEALYRWGQFLHDQFSVDTLQQDAWLFRQRGTADQPDAQGVAAIHTLAETETIAKLASGVQRFTLADPFNFIHVFERVADLEGAFAEQSAWQLINISLNRRQYPQAAGKLSAYLARFGDDGAGSKQELLDSILKPRVRFDPISSQLAGQPAKLSLVFRNANQVAFTARRVDIEKILRDTKAYYRDFNPQRQRSNFGPLPNHSPPDLRLPSSLFDQANITHYLLEQVAQWNQPLEPRPNHWDRRQQIDTPLTTAGLYLIEGQVSGQGAATAQIVRCLVWLEDTALVQQPMGGDRWLLSLADSATGQPIVGANIELFGFGWDHNNNNGPAKMRTENVAARSDANGLAEVTMKNDRQWFSVARTKGGRLALLGLQHLWQQDVVPQTHGELKAYGVSDRPLYRPGETVKAKFWLGYATYGDAAAVRASNQTVHVTMSDPQGLQIAERQLHSDQFGGCELEIELADSAPLGRYSFRVKSDTPDQWATTSLAIRVEEFRKPEFEVNILAPEKPVALGETIQARIEAKYYFGAPVTDAEVTVKVERSTYLESYYPWAPYDWCYGPGYWWFAEDYSWYPNWRGWCGCIAPAPSWRPQWGFEPPELVLEQALRLDSSGIAKLDIDTALAKAIYGDEDHKYSISVEVRDASRRTITAQGSVIAAKEPFKVYAWVDRGYYSVGDRIEAHFQARQLDGTAVAGTGTVDLLKVSYDEQQKPHEQIVASFAAQLDSSDTKLGAKPSETLATRSDDHAEFTQVLSADRAGQYRVRLRLRDVAGHEVEGGYIFTVRGPGADGDDFRYNALELTPDKQHYAPGETVKLQIAADYAGARVALFLRPESNGYQPPQWVILDGKSAIVEIPVTAVDQPNFFVEAHTIYNGKLQREVKQIVVPPAQRVLDVEMALNQDEYLPGEECTVEVKVTDPDGKPVVGSCTIAAYDRALEALASDVLPADIREFFWKWQRYHQPNSTTNLNTVSYPMSVADQPYWQALGLFGDTLADDLDVLLGDSMVIDESGVPIDFNAMGSGRMGMGGMGGGMSRTMSAQGEMMEGMMMESRVMDSAIPAAAPMEKSMGSEAAGANNASGTESGPQIRKDFADSALWLASLTTDEQGKATATFKMPENLTSWQLRTWSVASNTRVGSASTTTVTRKPLLVRLQTPRFLVERDEVVLSAIVHNDLDGPRTVKVALEIDGQTQLDLISPELREQTVQIQSHQQARIDWRCRATAEGTVTLRAIAITDDASDAMQLEMPIVVNGMLKMESLAGTVRRGQASSTATIRIPQERRIEQSRLVVRLSPSLAAAMIDALPYMAEYPYGCTEQTLNRFLPTVITQRVLQHMHVDLAKLKEKRNNLNAQELGDAQQRREGWKRFDHAAVFDEQLVADMVSSGVQRLTEMQNADGGWGWFSGTQETSGAHTTATVIRGLLIAQQNDVPIVPDVIQRGLAWLEQYQQAELTKLQNADGKVKPYKEQPDNIDALVFHVLVLGERSNPAVQQILYEQRTHLSTYGKALLAWATHKLGAVEQTNMLRRNLEQFLVEDAENETAYLRGGDAWWYWYGSDIEANAIYLKLLAAADPRGQTAPRVVKYLLNNRKHATYWNNTRDTALVVEAFADYIAASGEMTAAMRAEVYLSGKRLGTVQFTPENLFDVDNTIEIHGSAVPAGEHQLEIRRSGEGNLYWNAYATNFTLEEEIVPAGLEVKIERRYYLLTPTKSALQLPGSGAALVDTQQAVYDRSLIEDLQAVPSGQLVEVELLVESKNDYEYLLIEDPKAAGLEAVETQSGYFYNSGLSIYRELRDRHVGLCIRWLPKGNYSLRYQLRSEAPGQFTALPSVIQGMYAPELRGNSADFDLQIVD